MINYVQMKISKNLLSKSTEVFAAKLFYNFNKKRVFFSFDISLISLEIN